MSLLPVLVSLVLVAGVMTDECPSGFQRHHDSCYTLIRIKASWAEASVYCSAIGAHLAIIESESEQNFLKGQMDRESATIDGSGVWIGGQDYVKEGTWRWGFSGDAITKPYWGPKDLDNAHRRYETQDCVQLHKADHYQWDDQWCSTQEFFLCEIEAPSNAGVIG